MIQTDAFDLKMLAALQEDGRLTNQQLADLVGLSASQCSRRRMRLEEEKVIAGYHATHGIVKHTMPSEGWQIAFSVVGAVAVGIAAFLRIAAMAAPEPAGRRMAGG